jgi:GT2 family glycosyltransferase
MSTRVEEERAGVEDFKPRASVIVCAYSNERLAQLKETIASLQTQTYPPSEIVLIVDHNPELQKEFEKLADDSLRIAPNSGERGLANARNTGIALAEGEIVAFIDDDAAAESRWLEELVACYRDPDVIGAGGRIEPVWEGGRKPAWMPDEFLWVIGCSYRGMAEGSIRNMIGCNMSFRSSVFEEVGPFNPSIGRLGNQPLGCEETEICIRALEHWPGKKILYAPKALVRHHASLSRQTVRYFARRCYFEGVSKVVVRRLWKGAGTSAEVGYLSRTLPRGMLREARNVVRLKDPSGSASRIGMTALGVGAVGAGFAFEFLRGKLGRR